MAFQFEERELLACCGSTRFAREMARLSPFATYDQALEMARDIWLNNVDTNGWLEAFSAHPQIGETPANQESGMHAQWCKGEQSMAMATATASNLQELHEWNIRYKQKFGFIFIICASGRTSNEVLVELKRRYVNRPIVELEIAALEQLKITELRLAKLFKSTEVSPFHSGEHSENLKPKVLLVADERLNKIGAHITAAAPSTRTRPPITTHILDVSRGSPASGVEVVLQKWNRLEKEPSFDSAGSGDWIFQGSSVTDTDGRSGQLMPIVDHVSPGIYRISFNTRKYFPGGFYPYVSIVFKIKEDQTSQHFHVPLLLSPFSFTTYRGS
ncbi:uric acid degradation bifunctional protein TTL isoform X1 [Nymphaea colorata]|nr:uric acid degradation bifunctional protein TTL isoform X1 [Nymphaea colorata]XP_031482025.1 uric acid degradation bifunctional protein TTL isoform X1 [Nymphaea colorata]XP_031482026.1 uric acid degradation bifunctional protein TTL isoform X1 [Nymphaea colorata]